MQCSETDRHVVQTWDAGRLGGCQLLAGDAMHARQVQLKERTDGMRECGHADRQVDKQAGLGWQKGLPKNAGRLECGPELVHGESSITL